MHKYIVLLIVIISFSSCKSEPKEISQNLRTNPILNNFSAFDIEKFTAVIIHCDLGRLKLNINQYKYPKIEIDKSYQKYVHFEPKGDTLLIVTSKTPRNSSDLNIQKSINLYMPELYYLESNASRIIINGFQEENLKIINKSNALRLKNCEIKNLNILNHGTCNIHLDENNIIKDLNLKMNQKSIYSSRASILGQFTLECKSLKNTRFSNGDVAHFEWLKN